MDKGLLIATQGASNINLSVDSKTLESCLKTVNNIGNTIQMNICTGQSVSVPWGSSDWLLAIGVGVLVLICLGILVIGFIALVKEFR